MFPYTYRAVVVDVHDGDTFTADLDLGFNLTMRMRVRLLGCNARELDAPGGLPARDALAQLVGGRKVGVTSLRWDKYAGRVDGAVLLPDGRDVATELISEGWAVPWDGRGPAPIPPWPVG